MLVLFVVVKFRISHVMFHLLAAFDGKGSCLGLPIFPLALDFSVAENLALDVILIAEGAIQLILTLIYYTAKLQVPHLFIHGLPCASYS
jgi:hypothetical protein